MATFNCIVKLLPSQSSVTLTSGVTDISGDAIAGYSETFSNLGSGEYHWSATGLPAGMVGQARFYVSAVFQTATTIDLTDSANAASIATITTNLATANSALSAHTTSLSTIAGYVDSVEATLTTTATSLSRITANIATLDTEIDALTASVASISSAIAGLASVGQVTLVTPFINANDFQIVQGDNYTGANKLVFSSDDWNLTSQTLSVGFRDTQTGFLLTVSTTVTRESATSVSLSINSANSALFEKDTDRYSYSIRATSAGETVTLVKGFVSVLKSV